MRNVCAAWSEFLPAVLPHLLFIALYLSFSAKLWFQRELSHGLVTCAFGQLEHEVGIFLSMKYMNGPWQALLLRSFRINPGPAVQQDISPHHALLTPGTSWLVHDFPSLPCSE